MEIKKLVNFEDPSHRVSVVETGNIKLDGGGWCMKDLVLGWLETGWAETAPEVVELGVDGGKVILEVLLVQDELVMGL